MHSMKKTLKENSPLKIGSKVPELKGIQWIKGKGVSLGTGLTIVEIWATWCGPCLQTIPHLTELQKLYKGRLTIAGLTTESMDEVVPFVKELGKKMDYNVGIAPQDLYGAYMEGIDGIPNAFIINEKKQLLWQGHPYFLDALLPLILGKGGSEKAVLDLSRKKQEVLALHSEIQGKVSEHLDKKKKLKQLASEVLAVLPEDSEITGILSEYQMFVPGETLPSLDEIEWFPECSGKFSHKYNLIHTWSAIAEAEWSISLPMLCELQKKYGDRIFISALSSQDFDYISQFVESLPPGIQYAYMTVPAFEEFNVQNEEYGITYLFDSERTLLWKGRAAETPGILAALLEKKGTGSTLLRHHSSVEAFEAMNSELYSKNTVTERDFKKLISAADKVLKINPADFSVLAALCIHATNFGKAKVSEICEKFDISSFDANQLRQLVSEAVISLDSQYIPYHYAVKCLDQALQLSPDSAECILLYADVLSYMHLTDEALKMVERGQEAWPDNLDLFFKKKILENIKECKSAYKVK